MFQEITGRRRSTALSEQFQAISLISKTFTFEGLILFGYLPGTLILAEIEIAGNAFPVFLRFWRFIS